jgi:hypothetical protein
MAFARGVVIRTVKHGQKERHFCETRLQKENMLDGWMQQKMP